MSALAAGAVIVTTRAWCTESIWARSGAVELVDGYRTGSTAEAVERLLVDAERRDELRRRARALYRERFDVEHVVHRMHELYAAPAAARRA